MHVVGRYTTIPVARRQVSPVWPG